MGQVSEAIIHMERERARARIVGHTVRVWGERSPSLCGYHR